VALLVNVRDENSFRYCDSDSKINPIIQTMRLAIKKQNQKAERGGNTPPLIFCINPVPNLLLPTPYFLQIAE
jgi:hypothetical protein